MCNYFILKMKYWKTTFTLNSSSGLCQNMPGLHQLESVKKKKERDGERKERNEEGNETFVYKALRVC